VPVLIVPNVFSPADCEALIALWRDKGHEEGTVGATSAAGGYHNVTADHRKARDHIIRDPALNARLRGVLGPRLGDEIFKAFNFRVAFIGEFYIVCYDAGRGDFFGPHRDNWHPQHAHRRFAMTVSLNAGAYEGGGVRFPEYAPEAFDPPLGAAVVFSCSLLHEAVPVTRGERFILSGFMWGEAEQRHLANPQGPMRQGAAQS
jgi:predicted 2-oxoglutarate/Fe(II)-dependent dioxygenase YbiX